METSEWLNPRDRYNRIVGASRLRVSPRSSGECIEHFLFAFHVVENQYPGAIKCPDTVRKESPFSEHPVYIGRGHAFPTHAIAVNPRFAELRELLSRKYGHRMVSVLSLRPSNSVVPHGYRILAHSYTSIPALVHEAFRIKLTTGFSIGTIFLCIFHTFHTDRETFLFFFFFFFSEPKVHTDWRKKYASFFYGMAEKVNAKRTTESVDLCK